MKSKAPLVLMEQLIMVLVFALASAICVQAFVLSDKISRQSADRDQAVIRAQSMAEICKRYRGDYVSLAERFGGEYAQGCWVIHYDGDWNEVSSEAEAVYDVEAGFPTSDEWTEAAGDYMTGVYVFAYRLRDQANPLCKFTVAWQTEAAP